jgi:predicted small metal-binding protein
MKEFRCGKLVPGCDTVIEGESDDEVLEQVAVHAREAHGMDEVPPEVQENVRAAIVEQS